MTDRIMVRNLVVYAYHGVHPEEQRLGQRFEIDLTCSLDLGDAARLDREGATVSYSSLVDIAQKVSADERFVLIEAFANAIADRILAAYPQVDDVSVLVRKPSAPIPAPLDYAAVEINRRRGNA